MGDLVETMLRGSLNVFREGDRRSSRRLCNASTTSVDRLHEAIKLSLQVSREPLNGEREPALGRRSCAFTTNLEHVGDIIDKNLLELAEKKIQHQLRFSPEGCGRDRGAPRPRARQSAAGAGRLHVGRRGDGAPAARREGGGARRERQAGREPPRAAARRPDREHRDSSALHLDILRDLKRIHSHICAVAYPLLDEAGQLYRSRLKRVERRAMQEDVEEDRRQRPAEPAPAGAEAPAGAPPPQEPAAPETESRAPEPRQAAR